MDREAFIKKCDEPNGTLMHAKGVGWLMFGSDTPHGKRIHAANDRPAEAGSYGRDVLTLGQQKQGERATLGVRLGGMAIQFRDDFSIILFNDEPAHEHEPPYTGACPA